MRLYSRGKEWATGLSGTSDPEDANRDEDGELTMAMGAQDGDDNSAHIGNTNQFFQGGDIEQDNNGEEEDKLGDTTHQRAEGDTHPKFRDSLNMSQPVPHLDNSSIMTTSYQCKTEAGHQQPP